MPQMPVREEGGGGIPGWVWAVIVLAVLVLLVFLLLPMLSA